MNELTMTTDEMQRPAHTGNSDDADYHAYLERLQARFEERTQNGKLPVFTTDADTPGIVTDGAEASGALFAVYLSAFPDEARQWHNCRSCERFLSNFGPLVVIDDAGNTQSAMFDAEDASELYAAPIQAVIKRVRRALVTGVHLHKDSVWGQPETGVWRHLAVRTTSVHQHSLLTAGQAMAAKREDYNTVARALSEFSLAHLETAVSLLKSDALYRSEKVLGQAEWLLNLHKARASVYSTKRDNVLWRAIGTAPAGFCHPRASMIGSLLEDIASGMGFEDVSRRFRAKMSPLAYQRPQAAPSAGNIAQAEKLIAALGLEASLKRRYAHLDEVVAVWKPKPAVAAENKQSGVFGHLQPKDGTLSRSVLQIPAQTMTWEKFARTVLPTADRMMLLVPRQEAFCALVTAEHPDAPPLLQWDLPEQRNPVSWYMYAGGSLASQWNLAGSTHVDVTAITMLPSSWHEPERFRHHGNGLIFILDGAREKTSRELCLFPETLRAELREVKSTIEAYSKTRGISGAEEASACGLFCGATRWGDPVILRVRVGSAVTLYRLDRFD